MHNCPQMTKNRARSRARRPPERLTSCEAGKKSSCQKIAKSGGDWGFHHENATLEYLEWHVQRSVRGVKSVRGSWLVQVITQFVVREVAACSGMFFLSTCYCPPLIIRKSLSGLNSPYNHGSLRPSRSRPLPTKCSEFAE